MATNNTNQVEEVRAKISTFSDKYRAVAARLHTIIMEANPELQPRLWYGMPGYAKSKDSAVLCFFREDKYVSFGLTENATIAWGDDKLACSAWFLELLDEDAERKIAEIVRAATT